MPSTFILSYLYLHTLNKVLKEIIIHQLLEAFHSAKTIKMLHSLKSQTCNLHTNTLAVCLGYKKIFLKISNFRCCFKLLSNFHCNVGFQFSILMVNTNISKWLVSMQQANMIDDCQNFGCRYLTWLHIHKFFFNIQ